jgi:tetratricopeptide (TPR) repeat protein
LTLGNRTLAGNLYWLRTVQYIGEPRGAERGWSRLYPLADLVTDLDPKHGYAYQVAGLVLSALSRIDESSAILEKGARALPNRYILPYLRAFNAFFHEHDWEKAGRWAEIAARTPGAPEHVRQNVLAYYVKGRHPDAAIVFLEQALAESTDPESRKAIESQLGVARFERDMAPVDRAVAAWRERNALGPLALPSLVDAGLLPSIPPDPFGGTLYLGEDGRVRSSAHPQRIGRAPTPAELGRLPQFPGASTP